MTNAERLANIFRTLSVDTRVRIIQLLMKYGPLCVNALSSRLDVTQGAVSQHLRILRDAGMVISEKRGYYVHYHVNEKTFGKWAKAIGNFLGCEIKPLSDRKENHECVRKRKYANTREN